MSAKASDLKGLHTLNQLFAIQQYHRITSGSVLIGNYRQKRFFRREITDNGSVYLTCVTRQLSLRLTQKFQTVATAIAIKFAI
jgi:hypothetical protein